MQYGTRFATLFRCGVRILLLFWFRSVFYTRSLRILSPFVCSFSVCTLLCESKRHLNRNEFLFVAKFSFHFVFTSLSGRCHRIFSSLLSNNMLATGGVRCAKQMLHCKNSHFQCNEEKFMWREKKKKRKEELHCTVCAALRYRTALSRSLWICFIWHEANERRLRIVCERWTRRACSLLTAQAPHAKLQICEGQKSMNSRSIHIERIRFI